MDLGPGRRAAWHESPGVQAAKVGPAPPAAASRAAPGSRGDYMTMQMGCSRPSYVDTSPVAPVSYADMRTGVGEEAGLPGAAAADPPLPSAASPSATVPPGSGELAAHASLLGAPQGPAGLSAFTRVNLSPNRNQNQSAKVIRADPPGCRRRHSSETFSSTPSATRPFGGGAAVGGAGGGGGSSSTEDVKRHSSASFENVWLRPGELGGGPKEPGPPVYGAAGGLENGLNYIDLDLVKDFKQRPQERPPQAQAPSALPPHQPLGSSNSSSTSHSSEDLSAYASISFQKQAEDLQ